jgi:hypothetical protein
VVRGLGISLTGEVWDVKAKVSIFFSSERNDVCSDSLVSVAVAFSFLGMDGLQFTFLLHFFSFF